MPNLTVTVAFISWSAITNSAEISKGNLCYALCCFVNEIRKVNGSEYPGATIYQIVICLQFFLEGKGKDWKLLDDPEFLSLRNTVDNVMKERAQMGIGERKKSQPISLSQEDLMWQQGILGSDTPDKLRDTVLYLLGVNLALRGGGGEEHRKLRCPGFHSQLVLGTDEKNVKFLQFTEDLAHKTNQGGLNSRKKSGRVLKVYGSDNPERNVVNLYEKYICLLPCNGKNSALYKYALPARSLKPNQWYSDRPIGINPLKATVKTLAKKTGLSGKFTNHSLRATCATRMYQAGIDEQVIKEFTGHKSDCVRMYKETNSDLLQKANKCVSGDQSSVPSATVSKAPDLEMSVPGPRSKAHKRPCTLASAADDGECSELCKVLEKIDDATMLKTKRMKLSLKFRKGKK